MNGNDAYSWEFTNVIVGDILKEGVKARAKHGDAPLASNEQVLSILVEEVGEVAKAINQNLPEDEYRKELTHVASVALRALAGDLTFSRKP